MQAEPATERASSRVAWNPCHVLFGSMLTQCSVSTGAGLFEMKMQSTRLALFMTLSSACAFVGQIPPLQYTAGAPAPFLKAGVRVPCAY